MGVEYCGQAAGMEPVFLLKFLLGQDQHWINGILKLFDHGEVPSH